MMNMMLSLRWWRLLLMMLLGGCSVLDGNGVSGGGNGMGGGSGSGGGSAVQSCGTPGMTESCCGTGVRTCGGDVEFPTWGPCVDPNGKQLSCCETGEFTSCDGGTGPLPPMPALCTMGGANNEPEILAGFSPDNNQSVGGGGQIKVWITDEGAPIIAPGEIINSMTGAITAPGDRTAKAPDGYLWEPALYIAPQTAENGGTPHFPDFIRGSYNNTTTKGAGQMVPGMDPPPPGVMLTEKYNGEDIWSVDSLGLAPGSYIAEFVIHDGDHDRGVGCVTIVIKPTM
jgi:hypothetical protein